MVIPQGAGRHHVLGGLAWGGERPVNERKIGPVEISGLDRGDGEIAAGVRGGKPRVGPSGLAQRVRAWRLCGAGVFTCSTRPWLFP